MSDRKTIDQVLQKLNQHKPLDTSDTLAIASAIRDLQKEVESLRKKLRSHGVDLSAPVQEAQPAAAPDFQPLRDEMKKLADESASTISSMQKSVDQVAFDLKKLQDQERKFLTDFRQQVLADHEKIVKDFIKRQDDALVVVKNEAMAVRRTVKDLQDIKEEMKSELRNELRPSRRGPRPPLDKQNVPEQIISPQPQPTQEQQPPASETNKKKSWWKIFS